MSLAVLPLSLIDISRAMSESTFTVKLRIFSETLIYSTISILNLPKSFPNIRVFLQSEALINSITKLILTFSDIFWQIIIPQLLRAVFSIPLIKILICHHWLSHVFGIFSICKARSTQVSDALHVALLD